MKDQRPRPRRTNSHQGYTDYLREFAFLHAGDHTKQHSRHQRPALYAERLVRDAVKSASEARPPTNFVLYRKQGESASTAPPPIFDGAVATATPGGGLGTALHAAVALDRPLLVALLLSMGADGRSCHTAFRRLMVHEAACNGSLQCLTVLLEVGRECGAALRAQAAVWEQQQHATFVHQQHKRQQRSSFVMRRSGNRSYSGSSTTVASSVAMNEMEDGTSATLDTLELLIKFEELSRAVEREDMSELDAAREMFRVTRLSEATRVSLAKQGGFFDDEEVRSIFRTILANHPSSDGHGNTPLHWAAFKNETACVSLLLKYNANPNARAHPSGWTPLHDAAYSNGRDSIALLIDAGACVDSRANSGATPLCFAAQENAAEAAELLLIRGADVTLRCIPTILPPAHTHPNNTTRTTLGTSTRFCGYTPLHYCSHYNARQAATVILSHHTSRLALELCDLNDRVPLHVAVARGSAAVVRALVVAGARVGTALPPLVPTQPVQSSKPWNCLSQAAIDECQQVLASVVGQPWSPSRHALFTPADRAGVVAVLRVGKRLEWEGRMPFTHLWPEVLGFCGRGWFDKVGSGVGDETETTEGGSSGDGAWVEEMSVVLPSFC